MQTHSFYVPNKMYTTSSGLPIQYIYIYTQIPKIHNRQPCPSDFRVTPTDNPDKRVPARARVLVIYIVTMRVSVIRSVGDSLPLYIYIYNTRGGGSERKISIGPGLLLLLAARACQHKIAPIPISLVYRSSFVCA